MTALGSAVAILLALSACIQSGVGTVPATIGSTDTAPVATAAPTPRPTLAPLSTATPPPVPTATPVLTVTPVPPTSNPQPTATAAPLPTATSLPTATPRPPTPNSTRLDLGAGVFLSISPEETIAGRDVSFSLSGLTPWEPVTFTFIDPEGVPASWITVEDVHILQPDKTKATTIQMFPTTSGELSWERYSALDEPGPWSVDIDLAGSLYTATYSLNSLGLSDFETISLGTLLTRRSAHGSTFYYSEQVPTALVVDLQKQLSETALLLEQKLQTEMTPVPDVYLLGNRALLKQVSIVAAIDLGFEDGYYTSLGERPGIFMRTDVRGTEVRRLLTHEYIHHVFSGLAKDKTTPAWLTEGLSKYYEFDTATSGPRPEATQLRQLAASDLARAAARSGSLFSLAALNSQRDWNSRTDKDELALQYAQAYMAVRFLNETYGALSGKDTVVKIGQGSSLTDSIVSVTGLELGVFESQFSRWLVKWEEPERGLVAEYLTALEDILAAESANSQQRSINISTPMSPAEAISSRASLVESSAELIDALQGLSPPERAQALHQEAQEHFGRVLEWLKLELLAAQTRSNTPLQAANDMIPELSARDFTLKRNLSNLKFIFNIPG